MGLVSRVVLRTGLIDSAREIAGRILSKGPLAVHTGFETDQKTGLVVERLAQTVLYATEDKREGTSAFLEKSEPEFNGR